MKNISIQKNPTAVCQEIKLCETNSTLKLVTKKKQINQMAIGKDVARFGNSTFCPLCLAFVNEVGTMLKQNKTKV